MTTAPPRHSLGTALQLLGDRWTLLLLRDAFLLGRRRFSEWSALGISDAVLASRLADLVAAGVLERRPIKAAHVEYRLTESGLDAFGVLLAMWAWERRWVESSRLSQPELVHLTCGATTTLSLACGACGQPTTARDTTVEVRSRAQEFVSEAHLRRRRSSTSHEPSDATLLFPETMAVIGDAPAALIVALALTGVRRFGDFERALEVSPSLLTDRLRRLVRRGVLDRRSPRGGGHAEYRLTSKGLDLFPVTMHLVAWAERWFGDADDPALVVTHTPCGQRFAPRLACDRCGELISRTGVRWQRPGGS